MVYIVYTPNQLAGIETLWMVGFKERQLSPTAVQPGRFKLKGLFADNGLLGSRLWRQNKVPAL